MAESSRDGGALGEVRAAMVALVTDPKARPRERVAAARVILSAVRLVGDLSALRRELAAPPGEDGSGGGGEGGACSRA